MCHVYRVAVCGDGASSWARWRVAQRGRRKRSFSSRRRKRSFLSGGGGRGAFFREGEGLFIREEGEELFITGILPAVAEENHLSHITGESQARPASQTGTASSQRHRRPPTWLFQLASGERESSGTLPALPSPEKPGEAPRRRALLPEVRGCQAPLPHT